LEVKAWIELWLRDKNGILALVALCDRPEEPSGQHWPIRNYLAGVAERGQLEFFAEPDVWPGKGPCQEHFALEYTADGMTPTPLLVGPVTTSTSSMRHWGLNE
jgi:hypothetical protein